MVQSLRGLQDPERGGVLKACLLFGNRSLPEAICFSLLLALAFTLLPAAQVISLKMTYPNDGEKETIETINSYLPEVSRLFLQ